MVVRIVQNNGYVLRVHTTDGNLRDTPYLVNREKSNGEKISTTNGNFAHKSFIETEFLYDNDAKETWLAFQGYKYKDNRAGIVGAGGRAADVTARKTLVAASRELLLFDKNPVTSFLVINT